VLRIEFISRRGRDNKISQFVRAANNVFLIENAFSETPEKPRHAILEDVAPRTEQRGRGIEVTPEREHIVFVPASSMQEQECAIARPSRGNKAMNEIHRAAVRNKERRFSNHRPVPRYAILEPS
jgi:hypothetical protein